MLGGTARQAREPSFEFEIIAFTPREPDNVPEGSSSQGPVRRREPSVEIIPEPSAGCHVKRELEDEPQKARNGESSGSGRRERVDSNHKERHRCKRRRTSESPPRKGEEDDDDLLEGFKNQKRKRGTMADQRQWASRNAVDCTNCESRSLECVPRRIGVQCVECHQKHRKCSRVEHYRRERMMFLMGLSHRQYDRLSSVVQGEQKRSKSMDRGKSILRKRSTSRAKSTDRGRSTGRGKSADRGRSRSTDRRMSVGKKREPSTHSERRAYNNIDSEEIETLERDLAKARREVKTHQKTIEDRDQQLAAAGDNERNHLLDTHHRVQELAMVARQITASSDDSEVTTLREKLQSWGDELVKAISQLGPRKSSSSFVGVNQTANRIRNGTEAGPSSILKRRVEARSVSFQSKGKGRLC